MNHSMKPDFRKKSIMFLSKKKKKNVSKRKKRGERGKSENRMEMLGVEIGISIIYENRCDDRAILENY